MNADDYQKDAARTLIDEPDTTFTNEELAIMLAALDLGAKVGKVLEYVKKGICHRHGYDRTALTALLVTTSMVSDKAARDLWSGNPAPDHILSGNAQMLIWCALGLGGEAGEVMELASTIETKGMYAGSVDAMVKELGDCEWYAAALCTLIGVPMSEVMQANIDKLKKRFPDGWGSEASKARVDVAS